MTEARIPPIDTAQWSDEMWDAISVIGAKRPDPGATPGPTSNILGIYANHPPLVTGWMPFSAHLKHSALSDRVREMAIIRTTWLGGGEYEWAQHRKIGLGAGLSEQEIAALSDLGENAWSADDEVIVRAIDELCKDRNISDTTWARLAQQFDKPQLIDFVFMVSTYDMHCVAFNTLGLQLDEGLDGFPSTHPRGGATPAS